MRRSLLILCGVLLLSGDPAFAADRGFTSNFPLRNTGFSSAGGGSWFPLHPGLRTVLRGEEDGETIDLTITVLNEVRNFALSSEAGSFWVTARAIEEREVVDGELAEVSRNWYARSTESGDVYFFGENVDVYEDGQLVDHEGSWEAGVDEAQAGLMMPRTFLIGSRYAQCIVDGIPRNEAENAAQGVSFDTPAGAFEDAVQIEEFDPIEPDDLPPETPSVKTYAPGVGLIADDELRLEEISYGGAAGWAAELTFVPFSEHSHFPLVPGSRSVFRNVLEGGDTLRIVDVLDEVYPVRLPTEGGYLLVPARIVEERRESGGSIVDRTRMLYAQCVETRDVYCFGEHIEALEQGTTTGREDAWVAGWEGARPSLVLPGYPVTGARFIRSASSGSQDSQVTIIWQRAHAETTAGSFENCAGLSVLASGEERIQVYAPGLGLIDEGTGWQWISSMGLPGSGEVQLTVRPAVELSWPVSEEVLALEFSPDLRSWRPVTEPASIVDGRFRTFLPQRPFQGYFRLTPGYGP